MLLIDQWKEWIQECVANRAYMQYNIDFSDLLIVLFDIEMGIVFVSHPTL